MLYLDLNKYVSVALRNHPPPPLIVKLLYNVKEAGRVGGGNVSKGA